jgi:hypothetical protein
MLRKAGLVGIAALALATSSAAAAPPGGGLITEPGYNCGDVGDPVTIVHSHGSSGWVDQDHYQLTSLNIYEGDELVFTKSWGARNGFGAPITCSIDRDGFTLVVMAAQVP